MRDSARSNSGLSGSSCSAPPCASRSSEAALSVHGAIAASQAAASALGHVVDDDAQRTQVAAQQQLVSLQLGEQLNRISLSKALGGSWRDAQATGT